MKAEAAGGTASGRPQLPDASPSARSIAKATALALAAALVILIAVVLPVEYGIDPLGTGEALGLTRIANSAEVTAPPITPAPGGPLSPQASGYRLDRRTLVVPSLGSIEFKYALAKGAPVMYSWTATFPIDFDFHTEPAGKPPDASESFERGEAAENGGFYTAPYDGFHGWYWENLYDTDVTITLDAAGFFSEARFYPFNSPPQRIEIPSRPNSPTARPST
jgi:hypothetical protein